VGYSRQFFAFSTTAILGNYSSAAVVMEITLRSFP